MALGSSLSGNRRAVRRRAPLRSFARRRQDADAPHTGFRQWPDYARVSFVPVASYPGIAIAGSRQVQARGKGGRFQRFRPFQGGNMAAPQRAARRKIYLIQPKFPPSYWGQDHFLKLTSYGAVYPPLGLLTLAALTPPEFDVVVCDEGSGETIAFDTDADIVGITGYLFQLVRVLELADRFRALGKTVVLGGPAADL